MFSIVPSSKIMNVFRSTKHELKEWSTGCEYKHTQFQDYPMMDESLCNYFNLVNELFKYLVHFFKVQLSSPD